MSLADERVLFYLRNQARIEEWAALRVDAAAAIDEWLCALEPAIEQLAAELGPDVSAESVLESDQAWPAFRLTRETWIDEDADTVVAVGLQWGRGRTTLHGTNTPYVGLIGAKTHTLGAEMRQSVL